MTDNSNNIKKTRGIIKQRHPLIPRKDIKNNNGFILSKAERDCIIEYFSTNPSAKKINKAEIYNVPEKHPLYGKKLPFDIIKDDNNSIFALHHEAILGEGSFGAVVVAQAIFTDNPDLVEVGKYYAVKIQKIKEVDQLTDIKREVALSALFKLNLGNIEINENNKTRYYSVMPLISGKEMAKNISSYLGFEEDDDEIDVDSDNEKIGEAIQSLFSEIDTNTQTEIQENQKTDKNMQPGNTTTASISAYDTTINKKAVNNKTSTGSAFDTTVKKKAVNNKTSTGSAFNTTVNKIAVNNKTSTASAYGTTVNKKAVKKSEKKEESNIPQYSNLLNNTRAATDVTGVENKAPTISASPVVAVSVPVLSAAPINNVPLVNLAENFDIEYWIMLFDKMAAEIEKVHEKGVLHLDIKPENFMYNDKTGETRLIDFGLSKKTDDKLPTPNDFALGSGLFMAPEFFKELFSDPLSTKQDIYALARSFELLFYEDMEILVGYQVILKSEVSGEIEPEKGKIYLHQEQNGDIVYSLVSRTGKLVTEKLPEDLEIAYYFGSFGNIYKRKIGDIVDIGKLPNDIFEALKAKILDIASQNNHIDWTTPPYVISLPPSVVMEDLPYGKMRRNFINPHLQNFNLDYTQDIENDTEIANIKAINKVMQLIRSMRDPNPAVRPEMSVVRQQLKAIQQELALAHSVLKQESPVLFKNINKNSKNQVKEDYIIYKEMHYELTMEIKALEDLKTKIDLKGLPKKLAEIVQLNKMIDKFNYSNKKNIFIPLLDTKEKAIEGVFNTMVADINTTLQNKKLQLKNVDSEITTYERKNSLPSSIRNKDF